MQDVSDRILIRHVTRQRPGSDSSSPSANRNALSSPPVPSRPPLSSSASRHQAVHQSQPVKNSYCSRAKCLDCGLEFSHDEHGTVAFTGGSPRTSRSHSPSYKPAHTLPSSSVRESPRQPRTDGINRTVEKTLADRDMQVQHPSRHLRAGLYQTDRSSEPQSKTPDTLTRPLNFLVVGLTGAGKSSFINVLSGASSTRRPRIGTSLSSCTSDITSFPCRTRTDIAYNLIDTPGFDDQSIPDIEHLSRLSAFLSSLYASGQHIHGVIFLHRIIDVRLSGGAIKTAQIVKRICGAQFRGHYAFVTSMWDLLTSESDKIEALRREQEVAQHPKFWGDIHNPKESSTHPLFRFSGTKDSAGKVVQHFLAGHHSKWLQNPALLQLSQEMRSGRLLLAESDAGKFIVGELSLEHRARLDALKDLRKAIEAARRENDGSSVEVYEEIRRREEAKVRESDVLRRRWASKFQSQGSRRPRAVSVHA